MVIMPTQVDLAKRRYSQELAAYTLEQWRIARRQQEASRNAADDNTNDRRSGSPRDRSDSVQGSRTPRTDRSRLLAIDFATTANAPVVNGTA